MTLSFLTHNSHQSTSIFGLNPSNFDKNENIFSHKYITKIVMSNIRDKRIHKYTTVHEFPDIIKNKIKYILRNFLL